MLHGWFPWQYLCVCIIALCACFSLSGLRSSSGRSSDVHVASVVRDELNVEEEDERYRQLPNDESGSEGEAAAIILENVPIVTPNKDVVATGLTFQVCQNISAWHCV